MMGIEAIKDLAHELALRAAMEELEPYQPADADEPLRWRTCPAPNLGNYRPYGWRLVDEVTVDKGWGAPGLDFDELKQWCSERVAEDETAGFAITAEGQWSVTIGYFTQDDSIEAQVDDSWGEQVDANDLTFCDDCGEILENYPSVCPHCSFRLSVDPLQDDHYGDGGAYEYGKEQYEEGVRRSDNPYPQDTGAFAKWDEGWLEAWKERGEEVGADPDEAPPAAFTDPKGVDPLFDLGDFTK